MSNVNDHLDALIKSKQSTPNVILLAQEIINKLGGYDELAQLVINELHLSKGTMRAMLLRSILDIVKNATEKTPTDPTAGLSVDEMKAVLARFGGGPGLGQSDS